MALAWRLSSSSPILDWGTCPQKTLQQTNRHTLFLCWQVVCSEIFYPLGACVRRVALGQPARGQMPREGIWPREGGVGR